MDIYRKLTSFPGNTCNMFELENNVMYIFNVKALIFFNHYNPMHF